MTIRHIIFFMQAQHATSKASIQPLSRKQRELAEREQLILDTAQNMLHEHGFSHLTMDRIAEATEYSKGTIYNHFTSKEDIVCSLCCRSIKQLIDIFDKANKYESTRKRFSAIGIGYVLYHQIHPMAAQNIQIIKINAIREKISHKKLSEMELLEQRITQIAIKVVHDAIECGDLPEENITVASNIVFGCWSMFFGALLLEHSDIPLTDLGFNPTVQMLWINTQRFLDGYNWLPLSGDTDNDAMFNDISSYLYQDKFKN